MKFLVIAKQKKNVDTFEGVITQLLDRGQTVTLAIQQRDPERDGRLAERLRHERFSLVACPDERTDVWRAAAPLVRSARDWAQYTRPAYRSASKLHRRAVERLFRELGAAHSAEAPRLGDAAGARVRDALAQVERAIPSEARHEEFLTRQAPDVVVVTPGLHFGTAQTDFMTAARALGIPLWMLLFSWDNLSTKGALHVAPDLMFVWNERQRQEAVELHDYPTDRVVVAGAPRFDEFFALEPRVARDAFFAPLRLDPSRPTLLYLCSSRFIAAHELTFIRGWLAALRASRSPLATCNVLVRPHPDVVLVDGGPEPETVTWSPMRQATGWVQRPFDDDGALVLRTTYATPEAFFECLHHSRAVVALNTSAELEAGIVGRPVYTVLSTEAAADGQANTVHFNYLLREHGGFVHYAPDLATHVTQLAEALAVPPDTEAIRRFISRFLRPLGDRPVAPLLAEALIARAAPRSGIAALPALSPPHPRDAAMDPPRTDEVAGPGGDVARRTLRLGTPESGARVFESAITLRGARHGAIVVSAPLHNWLAADVAPGDVLYDVGAGAGVCSLLAVRERGAAVVAFEPGFGAFTELCENLILNECGRSVVPLPVALADRPGLRALTYPHGAGTDRHALRDREWRLGREAPADRYTQPVCAEPLDDVVRRHRLPPPQVMRVAVRAGADAVLRGAAGVLDVHRPRSVLVLLKDPGQMDAVLGAAAAVGYEAGPPETSANGRELALRLIPGAAANRPRPWGALRRAARRVRTRG
jgi:FkbM family methyltransferase